MKFLREHRTHSVYLETRQDLAKRIDVSKITFSSGENPDKAVIKCCNTALQEQFNAVCIRPEHVSLAKGILEGASVRVVAVIAFPETKQLLREQLREPTMGGVSWEQKIEQMDGAYHDGADEFDIMINMPAFMNGNTSEPPELFELVKIVQHAQNLPITLVIEIGLLSRKQIAQATEMCASVSAKYIKTSTGMLADGSRATVGNIQLIYNTLWDLPMAEKPGIKTSGEIRTLKQVFDLLKAGADIIGTSTGEVILDEFTMSKLKKGTHKMP